MTDTGTTPPNERSLDTAAEYDVFICHASEDKESVAQPLAQELRDRGVRVWIDETELLLGDSLRQKIDQGLASSRFGVVVLSRVFFTKKWTNLELDGLAEIEVQNDRVVVLPILSGLTRKELAKHSPLLAGKVAADWTEGVDAVASQIVRRLEALPGTAVNPPPTVSPSVAAPGGVAAPRPIEEIVQQAKDYLRGDDRIGLHELMASNLRSAKERIGDWPFSGNREDLIALVGRIDTATEAVSALVATYSYYGNGTTDRLWMPTLSEWATQPGVGGTTVFISLLL